MKLSEIITGITENASKIIQKYNIGRGSRVKFKNDKNVYYVERVAEDGTTVFVKHEPTDRIYRKQISRLEQANGRAVEHG